MKIFGEPFFDKPMFDKSMEEEKKKEKPKETFVQNSEGIGYFYSVVKKGDFVKEGDILGFIILKEILPNVEGSGYTVESKEKEIEAKVTGIIREILPDIEKSGHTVKEYQTKTTKYTSVAHNQPLFVIEKKESSPAKTIE